MLKERESKRVCFLGLDPLLHEDLRHFFMVAVISGLCCLDVVPGRTVHCRSPWMQCSCVGLALLLSVITVQHLTAVSYLHWEGQISLGSSIVRHVNSSETAVFGCSNSE